MAKWDISYTLQPAKTNDGVDVVKLEMSVKRGEKIIAQPKILVGLNAAGVVRVKNGNSEEDFDISLEPSLLN